MNKKLIIFIIIFVCIIAVVVVAIQMRKSQEGPLSPSESPLAAQSESENGTETATPDATKTPQPTKKPSSFTYSDMVAKYKDRRIQFAENCQIIPYYSMFKNGTEVMFDNRANKKMTLALDGKVYSFEAYGYKIVKLYNSQMPHTIVIDCGTGRSNGSILLQP